ncbi:MAG: hypothetical protein ACYTG3_12680 [Planctomycetota bacterium]
MSERGWLDTETKALLDKGAPVARTGTDVGEYSLVLLAVGEEIERLVRAAMRVRHCAEGEAVDRLRKRLPLVVASGLSYEDALLGQFEFICCDAKAVFVHDEVAQGGSATYLDRLYERLLESEEFALATVEVQAVPEDEEGLRYLDQFLGMRRPSLPLRASVPKKKARIMQHWATKIGASVTEITARR